MMTGVGVGRAGCFLIWGIRLGTGVGVGSRRLMVLDFVGVGDTRRNGVGVWSGGICLFNGVGVCLGGGGVGRGLLHGVGVALGGGVRHGVGV